MTTNRNDVLNWRFDDIAARLLSGHTQPNPPADWPCWKEPSPALPIDGLITDLNHRNAKPRLRSSSELEKRGIACPFYVARFAIAAAVDVATTTAEANPAEMAERCRVQEKAARQAAAANATIAKTLLQSARRPEPRLPSLETPELISDYKTVLSLRQRGTFERIAENMRQWRRVYRRTRGEPFDVWRMVFVAELGFAWFALTSAVPARNEEFSNFIAMAYTSIADEEAPWERPIRRVVDLGLNWRGRGMSFAETQKLFLGC